MEGLTAAVLLSSVVYVLMNFVKSISAGSWRSVITQLLVFVVGVFAITLAAHSTYASGITLAGQNLKSTNFASQVLLGLVVGSFASVGNDAKRAFDNSDSASSPPLGGPTENA